MLASVPRTVARRQSLPASAAAIAPIVFTRSLATRSRHHRADSFVTTEDTSSISSSFSPCASMEHMHLPVNTDARMACRQLAAHYWSTAPGSQTEKLARWRASSESVHFDAERASSVDLSHMWQTPLEKSASSSSFLKSSSRLSFLNDPSTLAQIPSARRGFHSRSSLSVSVDKQAEPVYPDLDSYGPFMHKEVAEVSEAEYDDLHMYRPNKFDAIRKSASCSAPKYDDLHLYGPTSGPINNKIQSTPKYDDLDDYQNPIGGPVKCKTETFPTYEDIHEYNVDNVHHEQPVSLVGNASSIVTCLDEFVAVHVPVAPEDKSAEYTDLHKYGPVRHQEPHGQPAPSTEELSKNYKDLHLYAEPIKLDDPHAAPKLTPEELSKKYQDLDKYAGAHADPLAGAPAGMETKAKYEDLHKYDGPVHHLEPHGKPPKTAEELSKNYTDLDGYGPVFNEEDE